MTPRTLHLAIALLSLGFIALHGCDAAAQPVEVEFDSGVGLPRISQLDRTAVAWQPVWWRAQAEGFSLEARTPSCLRPQASPSVAREPRADGGPLAPLPGVAGADCGLPVAGATLRPASSARLQYETLPLWDDGPGLAAAWQARGHERRQALSRGTGPALEEQTAEFELWHELGPVELAVGRALPVGRVAEGERWRSVYASVDWTPVRGQWASLSIDWAREADTGDRDRRLELSWGGRLRAPEGAGQLRWAARLAHQRDLPGRTWMLALGLDWRY